MTTKLIVDLHLILRRDVRILLGLRQNTGFSDGMYHQLLKTGARRDNLEAKVFGGGNVLRGFTAINVGERNAEFVRNFLRAENIRIVAEDLNDVHPRKVYFFPATGKVLVKKLKQLNNYTLVKREQDYAGRLKTHEVGGEIDLF